MAFKITSDEIKVAIAFGVLGFIFSSHQWLLYLNSLSPIEGLGIYYVTLFVAYYVLSKIGLVIAKISITNIPQLIGLLFITFSFFIVVDWTSAYVQVVTNHPVDAVSNVFLQDEDGAVYYFFNTIQSMAPETARWFAFVITPFVLTLIGGYLVAKPKLLSF